MRFNPVLGYFPVATNHRQDGESAVRVVSIPFWVSFPSRRAARTRPPPTASFNPVLGFFPVVTGHPRHLRHRAHVSIPFWVSSRSRPPSEQDAGRGTPRFNPVLGFFPVATMEKAAETTQLDEVSIPFWVSYRSRPTVRWARQHGFKSFNPVLGFFPVATSSATPRSSRNASFQSRSGFLPGRDGTGGWWSRSSSSVSIPFWVSSRSRRDCTQICPQLSSSFNPVLGFFPVATFPLLGYSLRPVVFQSRSGFLPGRDDVSPRCPTPLRRVSIPFWVSSRSRPSLSRTYVTNIRFQSRSGFLPGRDGRCCA